MANLVDLSDIFLASSLSILASPLAMSVLFRDPIDLFPHKNTSGQISPILVRLQKTLMILAVLGSRDGAVVRALASHQCGPGSIPGPSVICGLSLLLVLVLAPRVFLQILRFSSLHSKFQFDQDRGPA